MKEMIDEPMLDKNDEIINISTKKTSLSKFDKRTIKKIGVKDNTPTIKNKFKPSKMNIRMGRKINK